MSGGPMTGIAREDGAVAKLPHGGRIGRLGRLSVGCTTVAFDADRGRVLLTRHADNDRWCPLGGAMEAGESASEACERELREETGLRGRVTRLVGIYTSPHLLVEKTDGDRIRPVNFGFAVAVTDGTLELSDETIECGWFAPDEIAAIDVMEHHRERIAGAFAGQVAAFVR